MELESEGLARPRASDSGARENNSAVCERRCLQRGAAAAVKPDAARYRRLGRVTVAADSPPLSLRAAIVARCRRSREGREVTTRARRPRW